MRTHAPTGELSQANLVGRSPATVRLRAEATRVAPYRTSVLITGPSGAGKELVARQIHATSPRARYPFIPVDCASMTGELMASQLFGHVAGAFTGANCDSLGCFRAANRGTIFLDEIGELEYSLQAKLLRVLQERMVAPVGSHQAERVDVRVVAATNRDLDAEVHAGRFRKDLYYRLHVVQLKTTALCERPDDVPDLAAVFLRQLAAEGLPACSLAPGALTVLQRHDWPGNVRQLRNVLEQAAIDSSSPIVSAELVRRILSDSEGGATAPDAAATPSTRREAGPDAAAPADDAAWPTLALVDRQHIVRTLDHTFYNRAAAARLLGVTRQSLLRLMKRLDIAVPCDRTR